jgi:hypothetical protein
LTADERRQAVQRLGFTERQAGFLVTVMLHAGVCIGRQYCQFARIAYGRTMHTFFERLVARGDATAVAAATTARAFTTFMRSGCTAPWASPTTATAGR